MTGILGFEFHLGPEVPKPPNVNWTRGTPEHDQWRHGWAEAITEAIRDNDPWGLMCTAPDCDVTLRDVLTKGSVWAATASHSVHLLLAREALR